ncbi:MAG: ribose 5-phosphate isomerase B [Kiritimatiellia bacterium]
MKQGKVIAVASDHAGFRYKEDVKQYLLRRGFTVKDFGTDSEEAVDYPCFIYPAAVAVAKGEADVGIVFGGSGNGEAMVANKVRGIRCAVCWNEDSARLAKRHNAANMIAIGQRLVGRAALYPIVNAWLEAEFEGERHLRRIQEIAELEEKGFAEQCRRRSMGREAPTVYRPERQSAEE